MILHHQRLPIYTRLLGRGVLGHRLGALGYSVLRQLTPETLSELVNAMKGKRLTGG